MKKARKGFTLVELMIVIAIIGALAAAMSVSGAKATIAAKASAIYSNISNIKTAADIYKLQRGNMFKESEITAADLKDMTEVDIDEFNKVNSVTTTTGETPTTTISVADGNILYKIVPGVDGGAGAYVICKFADEGDADSIAKALVGYRNVRVDLTNHTVGSFLYHNTPAVAPTTNPPAYEATFTY